VLEYDAARKIAQGLGVHLEQCEALVEVKGDKARLLPVAEWTTHLFGKGTQAGASVTGRRKKPGQTTLLEELDKAEAVEAGWTTIRGPAPGSTVLDRVHQPMILFAANRSELLKRFLVEDGVGKDARFWKLADNLNKLYPSGTEERRWEEGVLARKKGLGFWSGRADNSAITFKGTNMHWEERIEINPDVLVGKPIIRGTRIAVEFVVDLLARGWSMEQILKEYDHLTRADIMACLGYASDTLKSERVYLVPR
jgi:uncharacterized protein (DUF433 family)